MKRTVGISAIIALVLAVTYFGSQSLSGSKASLVMPATPGQLVGGTATTMSPSANGCYGEGTGGPGADCSNGGDCCSGFCTGYVCSDMTCPQTVTKSVTLKNQQLYLGYSPEFIEDWPRYADTSELNLKIAMDNLEIDKTKSEYKDCTIDENGILRVFGGYWEGKYYEKIDAKCSGTVCPAASGKPKLKIQVLSTTLVPDCKKQKGRSDPKAFYWICRINADYICEMSQVCDLSSTVTDTPTIVPTIKPQECLNNGAVCTDSKSCCSQNCLGGVCNSVVLPPGYQR